MASLCSQCGAPTKAPAVAAEIESLPRHSILMNTNEHPENHEFVYVHGIVSKTDERLEYLEDEISRLQERLKVLSEERTSLHEYRRKNARVLSCLRRMPPEILCLIFSWTLPSSDDLACWSFRSQVRNSPWTLTWVSRRWREIALSAPSLWSLVHVGGGQISRYRSRSLMIQTQVQRARALQIHFNGHDTEDPTPQLNLFKLLSKHSARWEELSLSLTWALLPRVEALRDNLPALQRLRLGWYNDSSYSMDATLDCFQTASSLTDVSLSSAFLAGVWFSPQNHITRYDFDIHRDNHRELLDSMPHLIEARVKACSGTQIHFYDAALMRELKRLYIELPESLDYFEAPALEELAIRAHEGNGRTHQCISDFVKRSSCSIRKLCIKGQIRPEEAVHILLECPSITELIFLDGKNFDRYFAMLLSEDTTVAPQLRAIHFGFCVGEIDYELYLQMLESRRNAPECALRSATLLSPSYSPKIAASSSKFDALREGGFQFSLVSGAAARGQRESWLYGSL
ncbi:hypothetical protein FB45DRAFT_36543 [Roridomyces roridus]|uniref:F-box domain-containing protein n=1 Tax=Roridomyces roridus TaxID=1738132 RepID=A0AAD7FM53_9AGAR|nr:hypothetical protein FB45DRAFT_36543 [Roridomyces roridus]